MLYGRMANFFGTEVGYGCITLSLCTVVLIKTATRVLLAPKGKQYGYKQNSLWGGGFIRNKNMGDEL